MSKITEINPIGKATLETNAYGGCYINAKDFSEREQISPNLWRMFDHEDEAIAEAGPLYQYADKAMVNRMAEFFGGSRKDETDI